MFFVPSGKLMEVSLVQSKNASDPISVKSFGNFISVREEHPSNALLPISLTVSGMDMAFR